MTSKTVTAHSSVTIGHFDNSSSMEAVCRKLAAIHGPEYSFSVSNWQGQTQLQAPRGRQRFFFVLEADEASVLLIGGQRVRGIPAGGPYLRIEESWATVTAPVEEEIWPGDVLCVDSAQCRPVNVLGHARCFEVMTEATAYPLPTVAFLRHLCDHPGGCAAYPGAFRREALPPVRAGVCEVDQRGPNRLNEHTLDMRSDRTPRPQPHHHGPVSIGAGGVVNHSETALLLPRARYGLPAVQGQSEGDEMGRVVIYRQPTVDPTDTETIIVRPGSIVVTPATIDGIVGHCFENAFAMLLAIPGFVSPHHNINIHP